MKFEPKFQFCPPSMAMQTYTHFLIMCLVKYLDSYLFG
jgi:hypothetical protein